MSNLDIIEGKVWKFGDNISTTDIWPREMFPGQKTVTPEIAFAAIRPGWSKEVISGDCIVAGQNFGFGSHRAGANDIMKKMGIGCIVADSIARIYYRTAISIGFPAFICPGVSKLFQEGDVISLDIRSGLVKNLTTGVSVSGIPYPPQLMEILSSGGLMPRLVSMIKNDIGQ